MEGNITPVYMSVYILNINIITQYIATVQS
jgi:hypothetical protein